VNQLPLINTKASPADINKWKKSKNVKDCFAILFKKTKKGEKTYMYCIIKHVWQKINIENIPKIWLAYAISISEIMLNPRILNIQASENEVKIKILKNLRKLVSFLKFRKKFYKFKH
jgi:hypothetical protein